MKVVYYTHFKQESRSSLYECGFALPHAGINLLLCPLIAKLFNMSTYPLSVDLKFHLP